LTENKIVPSLESIPENNERQLKQFYKELYDQNNVFDNYSSQIYLNDPFKKAKILLQEEKSNPVRKGNPYYTYPKKYEEIEAFSDEYKENIRIVNLKFLN
jgi:hypothetical protein